MFKLVGIREEVDHLAGTRINPETIVAIFDDRKDAYAYAKKSLLKNPKSCTNRFKKSSLLSGYNDFNVREREEINVPHNPKIR